MKAESTEMGIKSIDMANIKQPSPPLLGYHSEKVALLWDKVTDKDAFCEKTGYNRTFISNVIRGKQMTYTNRVHNLIQDLRFVTNESRPKYQFLNPLTIR